MKTLLPLIALGLAAAACSPKPAADNAVDNAAAMAGPDEGNVVVPAEETAPAENTGDAATNTTAAQTPANYDGHWIGVEGMYLNVTRKGPDKVGLDMQWGLDADMKGTFDGSITPDGIVFTRKGKTETLRPTDGDATGLKYLAGKKTCLTVTSGEGYCRK